MESVRTIFFSPTGTTRRVLEAIIQGLGAQRIEHFDLTSAKARTVTISGLDAQLVIVGTPVYAGRVPIQFVEALRRIRATGTPAALVVVYGNRAFEDALLELKGIVEESGFIPVAGASFVGEHSYSTTAAPLAAGRPDSDDLDKAREFGRRLGELLEGKGTNREIPPLKVPGNFPHRERLSLGVTPESDDGLCTRCGKCAEACLQEAVAVAENSITTDRGKCILCCACVKACPTGARRVTDPKIIGIVQKLAVLCRDRKEPEFFFGT